jgi:hypothetical protein
VNRRSLLLAVLALPACGLAPRRESSTALPLLAPATLGAPRSALQVLRGAFGAHDVVFQCVVDVDADRVTLVGLGAQSQRWFSLRYDGRSLETQISPQAPELLDPQRMLADLQLALWPLAALEQALAGSGWQVTEPAPATRRLRRDGRLVAEVHYGGLDPWNGRLWFSHFESGYTLAVESQPLP